MPCTLNFILHVALIVNNLLLVLVVATSSSSAHARAINSY